jgi:hypothetical protein
MTAAMFKRLYHEAFHAYVENYVLRGGKPDERRMPRWLNEGLAQVFEGGRLEVDTLRIDQPDADKLRRLQADLRGSRPLGIAEIVDADPSLFLVSHSRDRRVSQRHYLYCWALTHYLIFGPERLSPSGVIEMADETKTPQKRLESLVGMPIEQFQRRWRDAMLAMRPAN